MVKEQSNKKTPNDILLFPYTSVSFGHHQRDFPPAVNGNQFREVQLDHVQRGEDFGPPSFKWDVLSKPTPQGSRNSAQEEVERLQEPRRIDDTKETVPSIYKTDVHMISEKLKK